MKRIYFILAAMVALAACTKEPVTPAGKYTAMITNEISGHNDHCGDPVVWTLTAGQTINVGTVTVENNETDLTVTYQTITGWGITETHLYVGDCALVPRNKQGVPVPGQFPYTSGPHSPPVTTWEYTISLSNLDACYCVYAHAAVTMVDAGGNDIGGGETGWGGDQEFPPEINRWGFFGEACEATCLEDSSDLGGCDPGDFRTQTMGGWGAPPNGGNPGAYMHANFATCFPTGVSVGCTYTINLTSAQAVTDFLPCGGVPASLSANYTDPTFGVLMNTLAGQTVALTLSVGFDYCDPNFGASLNNLADLTVAVGPFAGWTVADVLTEANLVLGGCASNYSASELNEALTGINENFVNGTVVGSYLNCP